MEVSTTVEVKKYFTKCTLEEAAKLLNDFSFVGDDYYPSVKVKPELNNYGECVGTFEVVLESGEYWGGEKDLEGSIERVEELHTLYDHYTEKGFVKFGEDENGLDQN